MPPRVSFLLPVYNEQEHLGESLASIAAQEYPPHLIEVLVADGNSTDGTLEIVQAFRKVNPHLAVEVIANPSRNTSVGRNLCLRRATGELVMNFSGHAVARPNLLAVLTGKLANLPTEV
ncbi:MAG: glycosyltransferase, partial [Planctomycetia bacterium]|nr:glycosyltransferase [Planctomycetia bacterium]